MGSHAHPTPLTGLSSCAWGGSPGAALSVAEGRVQLCTSPCLVLHSPLPDIAACGSV